ncbi:RNA polymerase II C-terminal domain kinase beta subunit [Friedmanniomyces endolithicus]|uniref:RNA polymerase II C-terminal domain kinase beta subunit n=1 Tax=Friedmanniomyces endolithicus TaxID=329885 RepID=A0AAN6JZI9_9PEZI|nr:RNA polymerase II C-terminal domain kinase beta subunit [Friedmanniomyces endolithicus]KAK0776084.1 RNA polymerase II C-terminal domain kinase beta subunit [Friedmanniomyces endolithicus]KAK0783990.1 RNA polymerase II C-terminal domain kinase beta subunit [Friedmanniomyces endolithicus]KAK0790343.1 RNA polymerase II C-terminal domain kinase beta subunit [Friedmanniomyces endolithicus]KAK0854839.1 RNA polymerase II C-terminal domain kinase beta subunit [Friedmanniomyces endolithicus]
MVFVDWEALGICKFWMLGGAKRCWADPCKWIHPPESEIGPLWDSPAARWPYIIRERSTEVPPVVSLSMPHDQPAPAAPASGQAALAGGQPLVVNRQPLGRSSRLFAPPAVPTPDISSSPAAAFPSGASSVWKRPESMQQSTMGHDGMMEMESSPPRAEAFWAKQHAKRDEEGKSGRSEVEVQTEAARKIPLGYGKPSAASHMHPPPLPLQKSRKRSKSPHTTVILASSAEQAAQITSQLNKMGALKRMSNGEAKIIGPHPSTIRVAARYASQAAVESALHPAAVLDLQERSLAEAREDSVRLQGVTWLDTTRRALQLPIRTFTTACSYFHYFRLAHPGAMDYAWSDAAAAALLVSCKAEDTLKKSRDILAAAYNIKAGSHDALSADDVVFEAPSRIVIGLERLTLESSSFDFRSKYPHKLLVKVCKNLPESEERRAVSSVAWSVVTDLHRTFAHLKQSTATVALASLELAAHLQASAAGNGTSLTKEQLQEMDIGKWSSSREEVMETLLDLLDLYTHHTSSTIVGTKYSLDDFLRIRLALNKECNDNGIPRFTVAPERSVSLGQQGATLRVANGHPTPVSPPQPGTQPAQTQQSTSGILPYSAIPEGGGTLRFMLNPQLAAEEKTEVQKFYVEEWEEYDEEIEVPIPGSARPAKVRSPSKDRHSNHGSRDHGRDRARTERHPPRPTREREREPDLLSRRSSIDDRRPPPADERRSVDERRSREDLRERDHDRERERPRDRDRERDRRDRDHERDRVRTRERDRDRERRYDDQRYEERDRYDRRDDSRRYDDYERRHDRR